MQPGNRGPDRKGLGWYRRCQGVSSTGTQACRYMWTSPEGGSHFGSEEHWLRMVKAGPYHRGGVARMLGMTPPVDEDMDAG